jgi:membrane fusion protein, multidrug efflux system
MKKMLIIVAILFGLIFAWSGVKKLLFIYGMSHYAPPPVVISSATATAKNWRSYLTSVGSLMAINGVDLSTEAPGIIREIRFQSGQIIHKGDVLVVLDTTVEQAELKSNQAQLRLSQLNYERNKTLLKRNVISQSILDANFAELEKAQANVEGTQAKIKQKTIIAPFDGKLGIRQVDLGQYISAGTAMVTLQSLDPLYVRFNLPEQYLPDLYLNQSVDITVNLSTDKNGKFVSGKITAINSKVNQVTRNILVEATIPNQNLQFYPGMFALVKVWLKQQQDVITVPETAISFSLHGDSVFLIKQESKDKKNAPLLNAYRQYVKVGEHRGNEVVISEGLKAGDQIVSSGQLKLQNGTRVAIDNSIQP